MADCFECGSYLTPEDLIKKAIKCSGDKSALVISGALSNYPDNAVVTTLTGNYIVSVDGKFILTVSGFVPLDAMRTITGNPIVTESGKYITI